MTRRKRNRSSCAEADWDDSVSSNSKLANFQENATVSTCSSYLRKGFCEYPTSEFGEMDGSILHRNLVLFIMANNIGFDVVQKPYFVDFIKGVAQCGPKYKLPTSSTLQSKSFTEAVMEVEKYVKNVKKSWAVKGCTIMLGKWENFVSIAVYSPEGAVFLKLLTISENQMSMVDVNDIVSSTIEEIGADHVVQIISNSDTIHKSIKDVLSNKYSQIYGTRCIAHEIHALLKAIYDDIGWVHETIDRAASIVKCFNENGNNLLLIRRYTEIRELKHLCKSKFASSYQMLRSMLSSKPELQKFVVSEQWDVLKFEKRRENIAALIQSEDFWNQVEEVLNVMDPLIQVLRLVEDDRSTVPYVYEAMENARYAIRIIYNSDRRKDARILYLFEKWRSIKIIHPIHAAAAMLNPAYMCQSKFKFNAEMCRGIDFVLNNLVSNEEKRKFREEMELYLAKVSKVFNSLAQRLMKVSHPRSWWEYTGVYLPVLRKYAIRILSQTCKCSCDLKPSAFEVAQRKVVNEAMDISQENFIYTAVNANIMENFRSLQEQLMNPLDLENCNELPDYVNPIRGCCGVQTDLIDESSDGDTRKEIKAFSFDVKLKDKQSCSSSNGSSSNLDKVRKRWRKMVNVVCISNYLPVLMEAYYIYCQSFIGGDRNNPFSQKVFKPMIVDTDRVNMAQRRWLKVVCVIKWFPIYFEARKR